MAHYLREARGQDVAAAVHSGSWLLMGPAFSAARFYLEGTGT